MKKNWRNPTGARLTAYAVASACCLVLALSVSRNAMAEEEGRLSSQTQPYQAWGYQPWWMHSNWPGIDLGRWNRIIFFELSVESDGSIANKHALPDGWRYLGQDAASCGRNLDLAFTLFDERKFEQLFSSRKPRQTLLHEILAATRNANAHGVHLDFEMYQVVSPAALMGFREFVRQLRTSLHALSPTMVLSVFGVVGAAQELLDRKVLAHIDFIVIQGYDAHWIGGPAAGPVAPLRGIHALSWEKSLQHYLKLGAQRSRLLFSIPYFGYEWPTQTNLPGSATTGKGLEISYAPVPTEWVPGIAISALEQSKRHGIMRDVDTNSPYYTYQDDKGQWRQGWFEDEASIAEKLAFVKRERLAGVAAFPLGYDAGRLTPVLNRSFGRQPSCHANSRNE